jgi:ATP adenylyltransferase
MSESGEPAYDARDGVGTPDGFRRLWTPHRLAYIKEAQAAVRAMKRVAAPHAFNVGLNLGTVAGGSLAEHLHQHVVPRWGGDANFIAVIGQTKVIPQLLSETRSLLAEAWPVPGAAADRPPGGRQ